MKPRLITIFLLIVLLPLGLLLWIGVRLAEDERERVSENVREVYRGRLSELDRLIGQTVSDVVIDTKRTLGSISEFQSDTIRPLLRKSRFIRQVYAFDQAGQFVYPNSAMEFTELERESLTRTESIWDSGERFYELDEQTKTATTSEGWHTWFWGNGLQLLYWQRNSNGLIVCAEIERSALIAEIIGELPVNSGDRRLTEDERIVLSDERAREVYQWGNFEPEGSESIVTLGLSAPFEMWTMQIFTRTTLPSSGLGQSQWVSLSAGLLAVGGLLIVLSSYFYRENSRAMKEASQRVSFVNQVSHELKTPLTNIRMYAEMLESKIDENEEDARHDLNIVIDESQRLSRLITNVLTFAKHQKEGLTLKPRPAVIDSVIEAVIQTHSPSLSEKEIKVSFRGDNNEFREIDPDVFEQILGNLISNVEKYAANGKRLDITNATDGDWSIITISDNGPGISENVQEYVFKPFTRLSDKLTDGVSGTGIGLTIARDLAQLHGGTLTIEPGQPGAKFVLRIFTPLAKDSNA